MNLTTDADLAERFGLDLRKFHELRRRHRWPHVRLGRFDIRFTDEQVEQIVRIHSETPTADTPPLAAVTGQTTRSARRSR